MVENVKIGKTNVMANPLGLGTNAVGGHNLFPNLNDEQGIQIVKAALDHGVNFLDTAYAYGFGRSEELIGKAIQGYDRKKIVIATKAAQTTGHPDQLNNSPEFLKQAVEDALERLQTNYIDIFYIHFPDGKTPLNEAVKALDEKRQEGKIKAIGISNASLDQIKEANKDGLVDIVENQYSLIHRDAEKELMPYLKANQISFVPYFPLASGLLTGKYSSTVSFESDDIRHNNPDFQGKRFAEIIKRVQELRSIADKHQGTIAQIVLAWYIKNPDVSVVIPGAKQVKQVVANAGAQKVTLSKEEYGTINSLFKDL
ncbi:Oxidoreductase ion channel [Pediococcus damnosus]|uniref:aldo/keto reductase n=1 Tax=Pediococcus damnosus TaxID=51663 RepID=UPI00078E26CC|nr:aldo/keto reductase [Pediococcus damnosus]AMV69258.1 Oxidoreductase ion channel [Pediococcus damnosus]